MKVKIFPLKKKLNVTKEHKQFYNQNGYIVFRNMFTKYEMKTLDKNISYFAGKDWHNIMNPDRLEFLLSQSNDQFKKIKKLSDRIEFIQKATDTSNLFKSYLIDKRVKNVLEKLLINKFAGLMTHVIFKHANTKYAKLGWVPHQDNSYAQMKDGAYVTTNLFIHKNTKENGCLYLFPGSHKLGLVNFKKYFSYHAKSDQKPGNRVGFDLKKFNKIDLETRAGDYLIMNGNLIHGSYGNYSKSFSRHMLSFNYGVLGKKFNPGITAKRRSTHFS